MSRYMFVSFYYHPSIFLPDYPSIGQSIQIVSCSCLHTDRWMPWIVPGNGNMSILLDGFTLLDKIYWLGTILTPTESHTTSSISALWLATSTPTLTTKALYKASLWFKQKESYFLILKWVTVLPTEPEHMVWWHDIYFLLQIQCLTLYKIASQELPYLWACHQQLNLNTSARNVCRKYTCLSTYNTFLKSIYIVDMSKCKACGAGLTHPTPNSPVLPNF